MGKASITFLNCYGDMTISWDEKDSEKMEDGIQKLIDKGYNFFIIKKRFLLPSKKVQLRSIKDLKTNEIISDDKTICELFKNIDAQVYKDNNDSYDVVKNSTDKKEIVNSEVICSKPSVGG